VCAWTKTKRRNKKRNTPQTHTTNQIRVCVWASIIIIKCRRQNRNRNQKPLAKKGSLLFAYSKISLKIVCTLSPGMKWKYPFGDAPQQNTRNTQKTQSSSEISFFSAFRRVLETDCRSVAPVGQVDCVNFASKLENIDLICGCSHAIFFGMKNRGVGVEKMLLGKKILNRRLGGSGIWEENLVLRVCLNTYPFKGQKLSWIL